jgi:hypothetical protein
MDGDTQKHVDDKFWDEKQDRWISDANRSIEKGVSGEALAALHGLHLPADEGLPYDVDNTSEVDDERTLRDKIIGRLVQISDMISLNSNLPDDAKQKWTTRLQECSASDTRSVTLLRDLRGELDSWAEIDPQSELSLVYSAVGALATMTEIYQRRFKAQ